MRVSVLRTHAVGTPEAIPSAEDPETARRLAKFDRNLYEALLREGLSREQAMSVVVSTGVPGDAGPMK